MSAPIAQRGAARVTKNSIEYNFLYTNPNITHIEFQCIGAKTVTVQMPANAILFSDLEPNTSYTTIATPFVADTQLTSTTFVPVTTADRPEPPTNVIFAQHSNSQVEVSWTPVADTVKWYVIRSTDNTFGFTIEPWRTTCISPPVPGGTFRFNLYAVNDAGYSVPVTSPQAYNFI
jgi:hypothetical protein